MSEYRISSADIAIRCDATIDDLIDVLEAKNRKYIPGERFSTNQNPNWR